MNLESCEDLEYSRQTAACKGREAGTKGQVRGAERKPELLESRNLGAELGAGQGRPWAPEGPGEGFAYNQDGVLGKYSGAFSLVRQHRKWKRARNPVANLTVNLHHVCLCL